jgi:hypothetical protein
MNLAAPLLPAEALACWRALDAGALEQGSLGSRVAAWLVRLRARALLSGGRLAALLIELGLCELADVVACFEAQLDAGPLDDRTLAFDLASDRYAIGRLADLGTLERVSPHFAAAQPWPGNGDDLHVALAERCLAVGDERAAERALARVDWHLELLEWLERHAAGLDVERRDRLAARTITLLERTPLESEYHVGVLCRLALACDDERWLARARTLVAALPPERLVCTPDYAHPLEELAWVRARRGDVDGALGEVLALEPDARWSAALRLLPLVLEGPARARLLDALVELVGPLEASWAWLLEAAPELGERGFVGIMAIRDAAQRFDELAAALRHLPSARHGEACMWLLAHARSLELTTRTGSSAWDVTLECLVEAGMTALLDDASRRALLDAALAHDRLAEWPALVHFVPDDRVAALLELVCERLVSAEHYLDRNAWIALGRALAARSADEDGVARFWVRASHAKVGTPIERRDDLDGFTLAQRRAIVLARLAQHQHEFLPAQLFDRWLMLLGGSLPAAWLGPAVSRIPAELRERQRGAEVTAPEPVAPGQRATLEQQLVAWLRDPAWPTPQRVVEVFVALVRLDGPEAADEPLARLAGASLV